MCGIGMLLEIRQVGCPRSKAAGRARFASRYPLRRLVRNGLLLSTLGLAAAGPSAGWAQSLSSGTLTGLVRSDAGEPLADVIITVGGPQGSTRQVATDARGRFFVDRLAPAKYVVVAERLGFRPHRVEAVLIEAGRSSELVLGLGIAALPLDSVRVTQYRSTATQVKGAGLVTVLRSATWERLPGATGSVFELGSLFSEARHDFGARGLPTFFSPILHGGLDGAPSRHPALGRGSGASMLLPLMAFDRVELSLEEADVERQGNLGTTVEARLRPVGSTFNVEALLEGTGGPLHTSRLFHAGSTAASVAGAAVVAGPLSPEIATFFVGVQLLRDGLPRPQLIDASVPVAGELLHQLSARSDAASLLSLGSPFSGQTEALIIFSGADWRVAADHRLRAQLNVAHAEKAESDLVGGGLVATSSGNDFTSSISLESALGSATILEFNTGLYASSRDYGPAAALPMIPATYLAAGSLVFGLDPALSGRFATTSVAFNETVHHRIGQHQIKAGIGAAFSRFEQELPVRRNVSYLFSDPAALIAGQGVYEQAGASSIPSPGGFWIGQWHMFLQHRWAASSEVDLLGGFRLDREALPLDRIPENTEWLTLTGMSVRAAALNGQNRTRVSPRLGLDWNIGGSGRWYLRAMAGIYHDAVDPDLIAESLKGGERVDRWIGALGTWPEPPPGPPTSSATRLSILAPSLNPPRSQRISVGFGVALGAGTSLTLAGTASRTTGLPRRVDLNRALVPVGFDEYGRALFGEPLQMGGLLLVRPGSNRRFPEFDHVWAIHSDGESRHRGLTLGLQHERQNGPFWFARYTVSKTFDNWPGAGAGNPASRLSPFAGTPLDNAWLDAAADLDHRHRAVLGFSLPVPGLQILQAAAVYGFESGLPFTPGFSSALDLNGDGVPGNDPATIVVAAAQGRSCLLGQVGRIAERNSCRDPGIHRLAVRLSLDLRLAQGRMIQLFADGIDLFDSDLAVRDHALYRLDESEGSFLSTDRQNLDLTLIPNDRFGQAVTRLGAGRTVKLGLRLRY
jgi:hypothetical protein